ncbi:ribosome small subunit-dependent GTPase A [Helcococcus ovis]|uniref:Small ribosomal subunit biogenesis GTPase RsgA n=1 Tax=Helcococcus ovis TaxID=72026 RepID=A0A4R9C2D6_9FIRM|nr:ribosome small subunit-dependent GTPase A [Helcococcus ovis]TFF64394.1 ribosome small subunit-dependent GTPase A [Helcococcus ovis]TFF66782.1 ribosome small subunit-dependent GTPase A [Helcococcus ovis]TFF67127.1 ribosome small subunit-dependent GTPase A [Helcococcus ovis]WNZ01935.1 ribosome small subunit-dependent GTPase A [Helcococcus ovis]
METKGIIIKSQKELYYVKYKNKTYMCKARGIFRDKNLKPLVGDRVDIQILDENTGYIEKIYDRKNSLIRPPIANIDQILLVHSLTDPEINYVTFDKYLVMLEHFKIPVKIIINKVDLAKDEDIKKFEDIYSKTKYEYVFTSAKNNQGIGKLNKMMKDKISSFAGPSGVGKSTILNLLHENFDVQTGKISNKTSRGKHTTRHTELFEIDENTFIFDTPGFSALNLDFIENFRDVKKYYPEFEIFKVGCKFNDCDHINEPNCSIKKEMELKKISKNRYESYLYIYNERKNERKF